MPEHSKIAQKGTDSIMTILEKSFLGSPEKKAYSAVLLAIIGYLIYIKNKKSSTDNIKVKDQPKKGKVTMILCRKEEKGTWIRFS